MTRKRRRPSLAHLRRLSTADQERITRVLYQRRLAEGCTPAEARAEGKRDVGRWAS